MTSTIDTNNTYARAPWGYQYSPYTMNCAARAERDATDTEIPAFEIFDAEGNKIFDTNEDSPASGFKKPMPASRQPHPNCLGHSWSVPDCWRITTNPRAKREKSIDAPLSSLSRPLAGGRHEATGRSHIGSVIMARCRNG